MRIVMTTLAILLAAPALAQAPDPDRIVRTHILPGYAELAQESADLARTATDHCAPDSPDLRAAYNDAFDAWIGVSHLRFGPSEQGDRAFALAFWPDSRGSAPKVLSGLIRARDPAVHDPAEFATVSIAARGFYALEYLLYDPQFTDSDASEYTCALVQAITRDIAANAGAILQDWQDGYADLMATPGNDTYRTRDEAVKQLFTALTAGLEFTSDTRLGRPMGSFDRPRPNRAEARRSGRSLRHVMLSLQATRQLAALLSSNDAEVDAAFQTAIDKAEALDDPVFAGVSDPQGRFRVEALQQSMDDIRQILREEVGPDLGIAAGFNALDGD